MNYAIVKNGEVTNVIWLLESNAGDFPNAVALEDRPVAIGDTYTDGRFYRGGSEVLTTIEQFQIEKQQYEAAIDELLLLV
ncbi:MAG: hypothetical protein GX683_00195 [Ruminococcaceae bacterium]|nr:hypothetical protein [Oscillospiraceae bacterium]